MDIPQCQSNRKSATAFNSFSLDIKKMTLSKYILFTFGLDSCQPAGGPVDVKSTVVVDVCVYGCLCVPGSMSVFHWSQLAHVPTAIWLSSVLRVLQPAGKERFFFLFFWLAE